MKPVSEITLLVSKKTKYDDCQMNEKEKNLPRLLTYYIKGNWGLLHMVSEPQLKHLGLIGLKTLRHVLL